LLAIGAGRASLRSWQDRGRHPSLTVLLVLELYLVFLAAPMAAKGLAITWPVAETLVLAVVIIIVIMSHRRGAIAAAFSLIWDLSPTTFANLPAAKGGGRTNSPRCCISALRR
jgi:hypothetical protein